MKRAADERQSAKTLPERDKFLFPPLWTETREDRESSVRQLLDGALDIVTDAPILKLQDEIAKQRTNIAAARDKIASLREKRLAAPESGLMPGILTDTQTSSQSRSPPMRTTSKSAKPISPARNRISARLWRPLASI